MAKLMDWFRKKYSKIVRKGKYSGAGALGEEDDEIDDLLGPTTSKWVNNNISHRHSIARGEDKGIRGKFFSRKKKKGEEYQRESASADAEDALTPEDETNCSAPDNPADQVNHYIAFSNNDDERAVAEPRKGSDDGKDRAKGEEIDAGEGHQEIGEQTGVGCDDTTRDAKSTDGDDGKERFQKLTSNNIVRNDLSRRQTNAKGKKRGEIIRKIFTRKKKWQDYVDDNVCAYVNSAFTPRDNPSDSVADNSAIGASLDIGQSSKNTSEVTEPTKLVGKVSVKERLQGEPTDTGEDHQDDVGVKEGLDTNEGAAERIDDGGMERFPKPTTSKLVNTSVSDKQSNAKRQKRRGIIRKIFSRKKKWKEYLDDTVYGYINDGFIPGDHHTSRYSSDDFTDDESRYFVPWKNVDSDVAETVNYPDDVSLHDKENRQQIDTCEGHRDVEDDKGGVYDVASEGFQPTEDTDEVKVDDIEQDEIDVTENVKSKACADDPPQHMKVSEDADVGYREEEEKILTDMTEDNKAKEFVGDTIKVLQRMKVSGEEEDNDREEEEIDMANVNKATKSKESGDDPEFVHSQNNTKDDNVYRNEEEDIHITQEKGAEEASINLEVKEGDAFNFCESREDQTQIAGTCVDREGLANDQISDDDNVNEYPPEVSECLVSGPMPGEAAVPEERTRGVRALPLYWWDPLGLRNSEFWRRIVFYFNHPVLGPVEFYVMDAGVEIHTGQWMAWMEITEVPFPRPRSCPW